MNPGPGVIDPGAPRVLRLALGTLPKGGYVANWRVRSVDTHVSQGTVPFGIGVAVTTTTLIPPPGAPDPATLLPPPLDAAARRFALLLAAVASAACRLACWSGGRRSEQCSAIRSIRLRTR